MWKYNKVTGQCAYSSSESKDYEDLPEKYISELDIMLQSTHKEVIVLFKGNKLVFDGTSYKQYLNSVKDTLLSESDWRIIRHQEELLSGEVPTLPDTEIQKLHTKRNKIRKATTVDELLSLEV